MDIQHIFYWFATIAMAMSIVLLAVMVVLMLYIKKKISDLDSYAKYVVRKADSLVDGVGKQVRAVTNFKSMLLGKSSK
jgi:hypothetical protein